MPLVKRDGGRDLHLGNAQLVVEVASRHGDEFRHTAGQVLAVPQPAFDRVLQLGVVATSPSDGSFELTELAVVGVVPPFALIELGIPLLVGLGQTGVAK